MEDKPHLQDDSETLETLGTNHESLEWDTKYKTAEKSYTGEWDHGAHMESWQEAVPQNHEEAMIQWET